MSSRWLIVAPIAVLVTGALFFFMRDLIAAPGEQPDAGDPPPKPVIGRLIKDSDPPKPPMPEPPKQKEPEQELTKINHDDVSSPTKSKGVIPGPDGPPVGPPGGGGGPIKFDGRIDGPPSPIIRPKPDYPGCGKGQGEVVLDYTVEADGSVSDVSVVSASSQCFAQAAERAARHWRYRPEIRGGQAVRSGRMRVVLVFEEE